MNVFSIERKMRQKCLLRKSILQNGKIQFIHVESKIDFKVSRIDITEPSEIDFLKSIFDCVIDFPNFLKNGHPSNQDSLSGSQGAT